MPQVQPFVSTLHIVRLFFHFPQLFGGQAHAIVGNGEKNSRARAGKPQDDSTALWVVMDAVLIANLSSYFTPEYTNAWPAMFVQSALVYAGLFATHTMGITETLPVLYLLKWCVGLFLTMLPCVAIMWAITD